MLKQLHIPPLNLTIPSTYGEELSYYEQLRACVDKINDCITEINAIVDDATAKANAYTDMRFGELVEEFNSLVAKNDEQFRQLDVQYQSFVNAVSSSINNFQAQLNQYRDEMHNSIIGVNARTDLAIAQNNVYILEEVAKGLVTIKVRNYFTGGIVTVQDMFDFLASLHAGNAITYTEMNNRRKTYTQFAALGITYTQLALNGGALYV